MKQSRQIIETLGRLKRRSDFLRVQAAGRKWVSTTLILQVADNDAGTCRFGITVSKKTSKSAVVRNRIKRRLRSILCDVLPSHAKPGLDYVVIGRAVAETKDYADLEKDLIWCLKRMELQKPQ
ncbi:MAG: ribonuclease P protein component [Micavibrio sp.]